MATYQNFARCSNLVISPSLSLSILWEWNSLIVDKIDTDKDGFVTEKELEAWVAHVGKRCV